MWNPKHRIKQKQSHRRTLMLTFATVITGLYVSSLAALFLTQRSFVFRVFRERPLLEATVLAKSCKEISITTEDGLSLLAWYCPPPHAKAPVMLFLHGNAGSIWHRADKVLPYIEGGMGMLLLEYRGYGGNPGSPTEEGLYQDARAALQFLTSQQISLDRITLYGESLGSGVAVELARHFPVATVILEAPYTSITDIAQKRFPFFPVKWLTLDQFRSLDKIPFLTMPLFILHGDEDEVVPFTHGQALFSAARAEKDAFWAPGIGHNNLYEAGAASQVLQFLKRKMQGVQLLP